MPNFIELAETLGPLVEQTGLHGGVSASEHLLEDVVRTVIPEGATDLKSKVLEDRASRILSLHDLEEKTLLESRNYASLMPYMTERYGALGGLNVLEIGPLRTTALAKTLKNSFYTSVDCSADNAAAQQAFFRAENLSNAQAITGDLYQLPIATSSQDVVFASRTTPLGSVDASRYSLDKAFGEIARVLKPDGEFVMYPQMRAELRAIDPSRDYFRVIDKTLVPATNKSSEKFIMTFGKLSKRN